MFNFKWFYTLLFLMPVLLLVSPAMAQTGQETYTSKCATCHGNNTDNTPGPFPEDKTRWGARLADLTSLERKKS